MPARHRGIGYPGNAVNAREALDAQIEKYRRMSGEQRLAIALDLHDLACDVARAGIRSQHPDAGAAEIEQLLRRRIHLLWSP